MNAQARTANKPDAAVPIEPLLNLDGIANIFTGISQMRVDLGVRDPARRS